MSVNESELKRVLSRNVRNISEDTCLQIAMISRDYNVTWCVEPTSSEDKVFLTDTLRELMDEARPWLRENLEQDYSEGISMRYRKKSGNILYDLQNIGSNEQENISYIGSPDEWEAWFKCREISPRDNKTLWDRSRNILMKRVSGFKDGRAGDKGCFIDGGCVGMIAILESIGIKTHFSCEGHPDHPYVVIENHHDEETRAEVEKAFMRSTWKKDNPKDDDNCSVFRLVTRSEANRRTKWQITINTLNNLNPGYLEQFIEENQNNLSKKVEAKPVKNTVKAPK